MKNVSLLGTYTSAALIAYSYAQLTRTIISGKSPPTVLWSIDIWGLSSVMVKEW